MTKRLFPCTIGKSLFNEFLIWGEKMRQFLQQVQRVVVKVGTSSLIHPNGMINLASIDELAFVLTDLKNRFYDFLNRINTQHKQRKY